MNTELKSRAAAILEQLIAVPDSDRPSLLVELTEDAPELRPVVESLSQGWDELLSARRESEGHSTSDTATLDQPVDSQATQLQSDTGAGPMGTRFAPQSKLGEGGQGEVWLAIDPQLDRQVALKVLRRDHRDRKMLRDKFHQEAVVTGKLEHPGIVPIYEAGRHAAGEDSSVESPYYVMRVYRNRSLDQAISAFHHEDWSEARLRDLLQRFIDVCNAIGYAHSRGVIHRDLKPQNVMLGEFGETLVVDWGLAKVVGRGEVHADSDSGGTVRMDRSGSHTVEGSVVGTPQYMSPEQAEGKVATIGAPADIYGLGAILYCVLTGRPPVPDKKTLQEILDYVRCGRIEPPHAVNPRVPPTLSAICLRALAKEPVDRYARAEDYDSPSEPTLAGDIARWLNDEPVAVYREPLLVRSRRWLRQHQTLATSTAAAVLMAIATLSVLFVMVTDRNAQLARSNQDLAESAARETDSRKQADNSADEAWNALELAKSSEADAREAGQRAEASERLARVSAETARRQTKLALDTLDTVILRIQGDLENVPGAGYVRRKLLATAIQRLQEIAKAFAPSGAADRQVSFALRQMADTILRVGLGEEDLKINDITTSPIEVALELNLQALDISNRLITADPTNTGALHDRLASYNGLGDVSLQANNVSAARDWYMKSLDSNQGLAYSETEFWVSCNGLGSLGLQTGQLDAARHWYWQALGICEPLIEVDSTNGQAQRGLAVSYNGLGDVSLRTGDVQAALASFGSALAICVNLVRDDPTDTQTRRSLSHSYNSLGDVSLKMDAIQDAIDYYQNALDIIEPLAIADRADTVLQRDHSYTCTKIGDAHLQAGNVVTAISYMNQALALDQEIARLDPSKVQSQQDLVISHHRLGEAHRQRSAYIEAEQHYRAGIDVLNRMIEAGRSIEWSRRVLGTLRARLTEVIQDEAATGE